MADKVYWKGLRLTLNDTKRYMQRNDTNLNANLDEDAYEQMLVTLAAIVHLLTLLPVDTPTE